MSPSRIDRVVESSRTALAASAGVQGELESFLAVNLIVGIVAECEDRVHWLFATRAARLKDYASQGFVFEAVDRTVRSLKTPELAECLSWFSPNTKQVFLQYVSSDSGKRSAYNNLIENRNLAAHGSSLEMTFEEVVAAREAVGFVLSGVEKALAVRP
jgi:hypothetical protein